jgi:hypothetical protein
MPVVLATLQAQAGKLLDPRSPRPAFNIVRTILKKKKQKRMVIVKHFTNI